MVHTRQRLKRPQCGAVTRQRYPVTNKRLGKFRTELSHPSSMHAFWTTLTNQRHGLPLPAQIFMACYLGALATPALRAFMASLSSTRSTPSLIPPISNARDSVRIINRVKSSGSILANPGLL